MSIEKVLEKVDAIEANNISKIEAVSEKVEAAKAEINEKFAALEAKVSTIQAPEVIRAPAKTIAGDVNRMVKEQLRDFAKSQGRFEKEIKLFESVDQYDAYQKEASTLTSSGAGIGGRTAYDPTFAALRLLNPMRGLSRNVATDGATYQWRVKSGNAGAAWGYSIQNNGAATTQATTVWQLNMVDLNVQFPIRTAALDDIDGLEANVVSDMLAEFSAAEGAGMVQNNDATGSTTTSTGGTSGLRGLAAYGGANASFTAGTWTTSSFAASGLLSTDGYHSIGTYDQLTTNGFGSANNVSYKDLITFIHTLPQQYWTPNCKFMMSPLMLAGVRGLTDNNGTPVFERMNPLVSDGIVGKLLGFDVVVNNYVNSPTGSGASSAGISKYPMFFGDWSRAHTIVDRLSMVLRRYDQTTPGSIVFFGEKRLATSIQDPNAITRYRSTATAAV